MKDILLEAQAALNSGAYKNAGALAESILADAPDHQDALYMAAVAARYAGEIDAAKAYLERLQMAAPDYGRAFQEAGHLARKLEHHDEALKYYQRATQHNPTLLASWQAQADILKTRGDKTGANQAWEQLQRLKSLPKPLLAVTNHLSEGRILKAESLARNFMQRNPKNIEGMRLLAEIGTKLGAHEDAEFLLETAIAIAPDIVQLRIDYIQVLRKRQKFASALAQARALLDKDPNSVIFQSLFAIESLQAGDYDGAISMFESVLERLPNDPTTLTSYGHALKTYGKTEDAITAYKAAIANAPHYGEAWYALANLKTYRFTDVELLTMQETKTTNDLPYMAQVQLAFALAKAHEDRQEYDLAFAAYDRGNALKRKQSRYTTAQMQDEFDAQKKHCTANLFAARIGSGHNAPDPIFIVGLPRAGSTLIEQILASHSQVDGTLELPDILSLAHRLRGRDYTSDREKYPRVLHEIDTDTLTNLGQEYIQNTQIHRASAPFFTDKMPNNFRHIGLIHMILPNAKIIDARRDPMDCCWSGFKQLFAEGQEFTYGLQEIGAYYRSYVELMEHWTAVLPHGRILHVQHENVLDDLDGQVRRILDYCGLEFEQTCVDFHQTKRAVRTASSEQVRRPINRKGQGRWQPYAHHLTPLKTALGQLRTHSNEANG